LIGEQLPLFGKMSVLLSSTSSNPRKVFKSDVFGLFDREGEGTKIVSNLVSIAGLIPQISGFRRREH
jgi:hypothetical protein